MAIVSSGSMPFKPYARLMNILGDQLITDKIVAVIEILKNCYDADSPSAEIRFCNMSNAGFNDLPIDEQAYIEISDKGFGMTLDVVKNVWLRPATPDKLDQKREKKTTPKGRIIQGEKGIGRFAIHKLGERIELYTKSKDNNEIQLEMDFSEFDPDQTNLFNQLSTHKLLEDVDNKWYVNDPAKEITYSSGTIIRIYNLRESWSNKDFKDLYKNIQRLIPPYDKNAAQLGIDYKQDFSVKMYVENEEFVSEEAITFSDVIERAQYKMLGTVNENGVLTFSYRSDRPCRSFSSTVSLIDKAELSLKNYSLVGSKRFTEEFTDRKPLCGPFSFTFYAFDLTSKDKVSLTAEIKRFIKDNFVYVLRDGVRVYPYGEKGIDWLNLDKLRSTYRAGQFISYNDLTGFIYISQEKNPRLKDASNRQGIVNTIGAYDDFTSLITAVTEIFNIEMKIDKNKAEMQQKKMLQQTQNALSVAFDKLKKSLLEINNPQALSNANKFIDVYREHLSIIEDRMRTVEDLAGLGMTVEKSSHETLRLLSLMRINIKEFIAKIKNNSSHQDEIINFLQELDDNLELVFDDMQMIQPLFKIQRKAIKKVSILESIKKVTQYFRYEINDKIDTNLNNLKTDFTVNTNAGIILQVLINLIDNAVYWLNQSEQKDKKIYFSINETERTLIIADNGKGIREDIVPLIFNEFFSMKSNGRGLGLYIVQELLMRINAEIYVLVDKKDQILSGANFIIKFNKEEE